MTAEEIHGVGPKFCADCKKLPYQTVIEGVRHPICRSHRQWILSQCEEQPERQITWNGDGDNRQYGWLHQVNPSQDDIGAIGDHDAEYVFVAPSRMLEMGAINRRGAVHLFELREQHYGKGLREEPADDWRPSDL